MRLASAILSAVLALSWAQVELTPDTFGDHVGGSKAAFVKFYAPWCGHCKNMIPDYEALANTFKPEDGVVVAKLDANTHRDLGDKYGVRGFPTIKYFPAGSLEPEDYMGERTADGMVSYLNDKLGTSKRVKKAPSYVVDLDSSNFDKMVSDSSKARLVEFYAPWCGHCKSLAPVYEKVAKAFAAEKNVLVAKVDADKERELGSRFGVQGFPTIKFFPAGASGSLEEQAQDYNGGRGETDFLDFLNEEAGTHRTSDGGLLPSAGRSKKFDELAQKFTAGDAAEKKSVLEETSAAASSASEKVYVAVMKKILEKGADYVSKESKRVSGMLAGDALSLAKRTDLQIKQNILNAFQA